MTDLVIGAEERAAIASLIDLAEANPVEIMQLLQRIKTPEGKAAHMDQMTRQTVLLPQAWLVCYSIEIGQPAGRCRHLSVSIQREGRIPRPEAVWMIAAAFGFTGGLEACVVYPEHLLGHGRAFNVIQPFPS